LIGIAFGIILFLGLGLVVALLFVRWSFYLGVVAFGDDAPGLSRSWDLTRKQTWKLLGLYVIFTIIIVIVSSAVEVPAIFLLGNSVSYGIIINLVSLLTTVIFSVGYAIMYFDLKMRADAEDIKELIEDYTTKPE
ncbi:hypothetical protein ACOI1D_18825, partial [Virgibacillus sp. DJP39]